MDEQKLLNRKRKAISNGNQTHLLSISTDLAEMYKSQGRYLLAIEEYTIIAQIYKADNKIINYAQANRGIGEAYMGLQQFEKAVEHQSIYLAKARQENDNLEEQRALATIGHTYLTWYLATVNQPNKNHLNVAYKYFMKSLMVCEKLTGISKLEKVDMSARLFANLGLVQECLGDYEKALELFKKSSNICKQNDIYEQLYRGYIMMAGLFEKKGEINETIRNYNLAIDTAKKFRDKTDLMCAALLAKSDILNKLGDFHGSKQVLLKAYKLKTPNIEDRQLIERNLRVVAAMCYTEDKLVVICDDQLALKKLYEQMGDGACDLKNYEKALEYYKKTLEAAEKSSITGRDLASCYYNLAETYKDIGQYQKAVEFFEKEYALCKSSLKDSLNTLSQIADVKELAKAPVSEIKAVYERAFKNCRNHRSLKEEKRMVNRFLVYLRRVNAHAEAFQMDQYASSLDSQSFDDQPSSSDAESEDSELRAHIGDDICLDNITDISEESDTEGQLPSKEVVGTRKRSKNFVIKKNMKGETALHTACINGSMQVVRHLIEQGHPINVRDNCGWLPIHEACICGHLEIVRLLLDKGAAINDRGGTLCGGVTPIHDAGSNGHLKVIELLLDRGASAIVKTDDGETPLHTLIEWKKRSDPQGDELQLCNKLIERLSTALEKAGQSIGPVSTNRISPVYVIDKENINQSSAQRIGKLRRHILYDDDIDSTQQDANPSQTLNDENTCEYRNVMSQLRKKQNNSSGSGKRYNNSLSKRPSFVSVEDETDDWLEDDMVDQRVIKKRKVNSTEKTSPKTLQSVNANSSLRLSLASRCNSEDFDIPSNISHEYFEDDDIVLIDNQLEILRQSSGSRSSNGSNTSIKRKNQVSLLDAGFSRSRSNTPPITSRANSLQKTQRNTPQQAKLTKFGHTRSSVDIDSSVNINNGGTSPVVVENVQTQSAVAVDPTLFVDVRIDGRLYRVPVLLSQLQTHTIKWLAEQAANRYSRKEYMKPTLELETKTGAVLADDDLLSLLFPLGSMHAEQVEARVIKWNLPPLVDRYKEACIQMNVDSDSELLRMMEQISITLNLANRGIRGHVLAPLCKSISHQTSLLELDLSANFLTTDCVQMLCICLPSLANITKLSLSCTGLNASHILLLANAFSTSFPEKLSDLDLSDNTLRDESLKHLAELIKQLKLNKLNLSSVGFTSKLFCQTAAEDLHLALSEIQVLDISDNELDASCISKFISSTTPVQLKVLNVSRNAHTGFSILNRVIEVLDKDNPGCLNLKTLNLSRCNVQDAEIYDLLRIGTVMLHDLNLSYNKSLTGMSLRRLLEHPTLRHINLLGCDNIFKFFDFDTADSILLGEDQSNWSLLISVNWESNSRECDAIINVFQKQFLNLVAVKKFPNFLTIKVTIS